MCSYATWAPSREGHRLEMNCVVVEFFDILYVQP
jgi:hypothetical protein